MSGAREEDPAAFERDMLVGVLRIVSLHLMVRPENRMAVADANVALIVREALAMIDEKEKALSDQPPRQSTD